MWAQPGHEPGPVRIVFPVLSVLAGMLAASAILAGLLHRDRNGRTPVAEVSLVAVSAMLVGLIGTTSDRLPRLGQVRTALGTHQTYRCYLARDGWLCVACTNSDFYSRFCLSLDLPALVTDVRFANAPWGVPPEHQEAQGKAIAERLAEKTIAEWMAVFAEFDVPAAPVQDLPTFLESSLVADNGLLIETAADPLVRSPISIGDSRGAATNSAPSLGAGGALSGLAWEPADLPGAPLSTLAPLTGVRVVDLTTYLAGPVCGTLMADLGAEVIKVEPPEGEGYRSGGLSCLGINRGKRGLAVDLRTEEGRGILDELIRGADVLLTSFRPGVDRRLGLEPKRLARLNARLVDCTFSGYGHASGFAQRPSFDPLIQALSGQMALQGQGDGKPVFLGLAANDFAAGFLGLLSCLAGLRQREAEDRGPRVRVTQVAAALQLLAADAAEVLQGSAEQERDARGRDALHRLYETAAGQWIYLHGERTGAAREGWLAATGVDIEAADLSPRGSAAAAIAEWVRAQPAETLVANAPPATAIVSTRQPFNLNPADPFFVTNGCTARYRHPTFGMLTSVGRPIRFAGEVTPLAAGPWTGQHSRQILAELGRGEANIDRLYAAGIVTSPEPQLAFTEPRIGR
jgi:crotonobetainyl-CoA:carnitine CoA-transferase CaiB-like acyl-CoA transferase